MSEHKPGCEALGGYGHGVGPCHCGADDDTLSPASLRTIGVEVGKVYKTEECDFRVDKELGVWALFEDFDGHRDSTLIAKLTSLSQARALLAGLGVVS